jgi:hypothetical protein
MPWAGVECPSGPRKPGPDRDGMFRPLLYWMMDL